METLKKKIPPSTLATQLIHNDLKQYQNLMKRIQFYLLFYIGHNAKFLFFSFYIYLTTLIFILLILHKKNMDYEINISVI